MKKIVLLIMSIYCGGVALLAQGNNIIRFDGQQDSVVALPHMQIDKERSVGAVSTVTGEQLSHSTRYEINTAMTGLASGLFVLGGSTNPGSEAATWKIRGLSRGNDGDGPLIVIDGQNNRSLSSITIEEVESVQVLKDITAKMLYGSKAANGVIMITTKRGKGKTRYRATGEFGLKQAVHIPEFINSKDYTRLYNQALKNDGLASLYSAEDIAGYAAANNPEKYPDVDFYDIFLKENTQFYRANLQVEGSRNKIGYFLNLGYYGENGLEAVGDGTKYTRLNVRSNLDYQINDYISSYLDIAARWDLWSRPNLSYSVFFNSLSTHRPNDYPLFMGEYGDENSLGWGVNQSTNLYGELTRKGYADDENSFAQTNMGLKFNLNHLVRGLTAKVSLSYDAYNAISKGKTYTYSRVRLEEDGSYVRVGEDNLKGTESKFSDDTYRNLGLNGQVDYSTSWQKHELLANMVYNVQRKSVKTILNGPSTIQDDKSMNVGLRMNYAYDRKYIVELDASLMGSDKFIKENRWGMFGAVGLAWNISRENFMRELDWLDVLRVKGSFGVMGYDNAYDYLMYESFYSSNGNFRTGNKNSMIEYGHKISQIGNKDFTFEKSRELNIGLEGRFLKDRLALDANYFYEYRYDIPTELKYQIPSYVGFNATYPNMNYNEISNRGFELSVSWGDRTGALKYQVGANFMYTKAIHEKIDEKNMYTHQNRAGRETDAIMGWLADGLYQNEAEVQEHGVISKYGNIKPGDIKLLDVINDRGDNIIDDYDKVFIGNSFPRVNYALNLNLEYKGISLYLLGQGVAGFDRMMSNSYYFCTGQSKYSEKVLGTAIVNPETGNIQQGATYPRLTSLDNGHSYRASTYWIEKGSYFKLRTAELAYTIPASICSKIGADNLKVFVKGDNLFTLSTIKDLDPENINAGLTGNPMFRTFSVGIVLNY